MNTNFIEIATNFVERNSNENGEFVDAVLNLMHEFRNNGEWFKKINLKDGEAHRGTNKEYCDWQKEILAGRGFRFLTPSTDITVEEYFNVLCKRALEIVGIVEGVWKMAEMISKEDWEEGIDDYAVSTKHTYEWYDNMPFFGTEVDEDGDAFLSLSNSESAFCETVSVDDPENVFDVYDAIVFLTGEFDKYIKGLDEETIEKCEAEGSCCVNDWWIA